MMSKITPFPSITLLITHFNRSKSLARLLGVLKQNEIIFAEVIVSDGGSNIKHLEAAKVLQAEHNFTLLTTDVNLGLGNSINVGQDKANTPYIVYIQEDFVPKPALFEALSNGLDIMEKEKQWDVVRFYSFPWAKFPYSKPYKKGFSELLFSLNPWYSNHLKFYVYSDHPHLKRKTFADKFGRYVETIDSDFTENSMCRTFLKKNGRALYYNNSHDLFEHVNSSEEPGLFRPHKEKTKKLSDIKAFYKVYVKIKTIRETLSYIASK